MRPAPAIIRIGRCGLVQPPSTMDVGRKLEDRANSDQEYPSTNNHGGVRYPRSRERLKRVVVDGRRPRGRLASKRAGSSGTSRWSGWRRPGRGRRSGRRSAGRVPARVDGVGVRPLATASASACGRRRATARELVVGEVADRAPGVEAGGEAGLALEDVADAGDQALVEQGVAEAAAGSARRGETARGRSPAARMSGPRRASWGSRRRRSAGSTRRVGPPNWTASWRSPPAPPRRARGRRQGAPRG